MIETKVVLFCGGSGFAITGYDFGQAPLKDLGPYPGLAVMSNRLCEDEGTIYPMRSYAKLMWRRDADCWRRGEIERDVVASADLDKR